MSTFGTMMYTFLRTLPLLFLALLLGSGCANYLAPFDVAPAQPAVPSAVNDELKALPPPQEKIVVAVYRFRDQTGQYKASDRIASWSTAVTQGATSVLIRALEESNWFVPIEREGLSNLMTERQIVQSVRAQHQGPDGQPLGPLPPLLYAGVLLEGGIIGYDTNVLTGGAGLRYFGVGGSGQFRQDQVTIYLRAVSTQNGRVLKTVYTTKTIISQKVDASLFRYVDTNKLLESEVGYSFNEPPVLAVTEAIEESVKNLIIEGVRENLWALANPAEATSELFLAYDAARDDAETMNYFGQRVSTAYRPGRGLGASVGAMRYEGNYEDPLARPAGEVFLRGNVAPRWGLGLTASLGEVAAEKAFSRSHVAADAQVLYYVLPYSRFTPFLLAGTGVLVQNGNEQQPSENTVFPYLTGGGGFEWMVSPRFGLNLYMSNYYSLIDGLDGVKAGAVNDNVWSLKTGFTYYLF